MNIDLEKTQSYLIWLKKKLYLDVLSKSIKTRERFVKRGQVYWCHFGINIGSEMSKADCRPCVILQNNIGNFKSPNTIVAPITHVTDTAPYIIDFTEHYDSKGNCVLDGKINLSNIVCISKARLDDPVLKDGVIVTIPNNELKKVDEGIAKIFDIIGYYKTIQEQLADKLNYIKKIKKDRNKAQDLLRDIKKELAVENNNEILIKIKKLMVDKSEYQ
ncbi:MAG: type II toxin-antitoxin system PemK/MazF family toxin [Eubacteriales bacterium]|nr:type II toxin-antitoxin system PemK/MazF family toxin [Eubacteriales bacterium]